MRRIAWQCDPMMVDGLWRKKSVLRGFSFTAAVSAHSSLTRGACAFRFTRYFRVSKLWIFYFVSCVGCCGQDYSILFGEFMILMIHSIQHYLRIAFPFDPSTYLGMLVFYKHFFVKIFHFLFKIFQSKLIFIFKRYDRRRRHLEVITC